MLSKKKILALVPARGGSKGIKLKNLKKINNKSLIEITSDFIDECNFFDLKILSTDNRLILKHAKNLNFEIVKRNRKLSGDQVSDIDVIKHSLFEISKKHLIFDYLVYLQPTSPIRNKNHLLTTLKKVIKNNYDSSWSITKVNLKYHPLKSLKIFKNKLKLFDNKGKKIIARQMLKETYIRNGVFYIFNIKELMRQNSIYLNKTLPSITNYDIVNIDHLDDLRRAKKMLNIKLKVNRANNF